MGVGEIYLLSIRVHGTRCLFEKFPNFRVIMSLAQLSWSFRLNRYSQERNGLFGINT